MRFGRAMREHGDVTLDQLAAAAASAPTVAKLRAFVDWVGAGRALTQTGRLRRADALALVERLDTGDVLDPRFPIQSSGELYRLTLLVELAKASGVVRVLRGRIVPVRRHAGLLATPVALVERLLRAVPRLGHELGDSVLTADTTHILETLFADLVGHGGTLTVDRANEVAWTTTLRRYWFPNATEQQVEFQRRLAAGDVSRMLDFVAGLGAITVADGVVAATPLGSRTVGAWLGLGTPESDTLRVKLTLLDSADPEVWRRLQVPTDVRLDRFHQAVGAAMGWQDSHLHVFERGSDRFGIADPELEIRADREVTIGALLVHPGDRLDYEYDFGDSWRHEIALEAVEKGPNDGLWCIDGAGRCPPEDVGGIPGYEDLRQILANPDSERHPEMLEWLGLERADQFDTRAFSVEDANDAISGALLAPVA